MYMVPLEIPKCCNECPFGHLKYNNPYEREYFCATDKQMNQSNTYGYVCNVEFQDNHMYTKVSRTKIGEDIKKPDWCKLKKVSENE